jgi:hypothetical protein
MKTFLAHKFSKHKSATWSLRYDNTTDPFYGFKLVADLKWSNSNILYDTIQNINRQNVNRQNDRRNEVRISVKLVGSLVSVWKANL